jgi:hypothetical protein
MTNKLNKRGQLTVFIIIAIVIIGGIIGYVLLRDAGGITGIPREILPVYEYFISCVEDETEIAASLMGSQAGYLELPEFEAGSDFMPFSSHLDFLGSSVPYWYYISGNGIAKEQIPSKAKMEQQLGEYLEMRIEECSFSDFEVQGFVVEKGELDVSTVIGEREIQVEVDMPLTMTFDEITARQEVHNIEVSSRLGKFYDIARKIYDKEEDSLFLENYALDALRLYAPVDGVELDCSPKIWSQEEIKGDLTSALEANTQAIKVRGDYYSLDKGDKGYFVQDIGEVVGRNGEYVNFLYLSDWPTKIEIYPDDDPLIAEPVGLEEGMGVLGFCYVPYHFIYDIAHPVLIQIYDAEEMFQFPVGVVIDKNKPRKAEDAVGLPNVAPELCEHKLTEMSVYTYDNKLEPVEARIKFKCFDTNCYIGDTKFSGGDAVLIADFPQCANGFVIASAEGYETEKEVASTIRSDAVSVIMNKKYKIGVEIRKDNDMLGEDYAILTFTNDGEVNTVVYPEQQEVELVGGQYEIKVYVYTNSTVNLKGSSTEKCVEVSKTGILGLFGDTEEKCFTLEVPDQVVSFAVSGGGMEEYYITETELEAGKIIINAEDFGVPDEVEELQINYNNVEVRGLEVWFE